MLCIIQNQLPIFISEKYSVGYINQRYRNDIFKMYSNDKIAKYVAGETHITLEDTENFMNLIYQRISDGNNLYLGIFDTSAKRLIGIVRFLEKEDPSTVTIGYALSEEYWGQGIVPAVLEKLFKLVAFEGRYSRIRATIRPENYKSKKCLEKLGFEFVDSFLKEDSKDSASERLLYYKRL